MSSLERKIYSILTKEKVSFVQEKQFKDCYNGLYRFDFYLPKENIVIEAHGAQHYEQNSQFHKTRSDFLKAQERDRRKIAYCLAHNIKMYCIPYWDIEDISSLKDMKKEKYRAYTKFHNDEVWKKQKLKEKGR